MFGDMELVRNAQQDAPTFRRVSLDLSQNQQQARNPSLRRLSTSSSISSTSSVSQASSPTFSSSLPTHGFWPDKVSGLFRTGSMPQHAPLSPIQGTPEVKVPALIRTLSKGMDAFR